MTMHPVVVVLLEGVLPLDVAIPLQVFARERRADYEVRTASPDGRPVGVAGGVHLAPDGDLELLRDARTVIVPGYADAPDRAVEPAVLAALQAAARRGARIMAICSGAFALAQAGVLDGLPATTHWAMCDALARQHPSVAVDASVLFVDSGLVLTSGGMTAGIDLCLHVLAKDLGPEVARDVSRRLVMAPRRYEDQRQFADPVRIAPTDELVAEAQQWMLASLTEPLTVAAIARHAHVSERTFHRRFVEQVGSPPLAWLTEQRIARVKDLLETTELSVEQIAARTGLGTPANLRAHFKRATSLSPQEHRRRFSFVPSPSG